MLAYLMKGHRYACKLPIAERSAICVSIVAEHGSPLSNSQHVPGREEAHWSLPTAVKTLVLSPPSTTKHNRVLRNSQRRIHLRNHWGTFTSSDRGHLCKDDNEKSLLFQRRTRVCRNYPVALEDTTILGATNGTFNIL